MSDKTNKNSFFIGGKSTFDKYDSMYGFAMGFIASQIAGTLVLLLTDSDIFGTLFMQAAMFIFVYAFSRRRQIDFENAVKFRMPENKYILWLVLLAPSLLAVMLPIQTLWATFIESLGFNPGTVAISYGNGSFSKLFAVLIIAIGPALGEEFLFRGMIANGFASNGKTLKAILLSAALFALMHCNPIQLIHPFAVGVVLAFVMFRTNSIGAACIIHLLNNLITVALDLIFGTRFDAFYNGNWWWLMIVGVVVLGGSLFMIIRLSAKDCKRAKEVPADKEADGVQIMYRADTYNSKVIGLTVSDSLSMRRRISVIWFAVVCVLCAFTFVMVLSGVTP